MSVTPIAVDVYHDVPLVEEILDEAEHYLGLGILHSTSCVCWGCLLVDIKNIALAYITMDDIAIGA
jgi:hypothetical protein